MAIPDPYAPLRRFGNTAMNVLSMRNQMKQQDLQNALAERQQKMQEQMLDRKMQKQNAISDLFQPQQVGGPMMAQQGQNYQPVQDVQQMPSREQIASTLGQFGDLEGASQFMPQKADPYEGLSSGYQTFARANRMDPRDPATYRAYQQSQIDQKRAGATNVTTNVGDSGPQVGSIPKGYELRQEKNGSYRMSPIPGGPVAREEEELAEKQKGRKEQTARAGKTVIQDLNRALNIVNRNRSAVGAPYLMTQHIPESDAQAAQGMISSALSNVGLDTLQQMRENSPTGGALGQVPIQQQKRLEQVLGSLDLSQKPEIVKDNLRRVINIYKDIVYGQPEQIQQLVDQGKVSEKRTQDLMFRYPLSFDEFGRPKQGGSQGSGIEIISVE